MLVSETLARLSARELRGAPKRRSALQAPRASQPQQLAGITSPSRPRRGAAERGRTTHRLRGLLDGEGMWTACVMILGSLRRPVHRTPAGREARAGLSMPV